MTKQALYEKIESLERREQDLEATNLKLRGLIRRLITLVESQAHFISNRVE